MQVALVPLHTDPVRKARAAALPGARKGLSVLAMAPDPVFIEMCLAKKGPVASLITAQQGVGSCVITAMESQGTGLCEGSTTAFITTDQRLFSCMNVPVQFDGRVA